MKNEISKHILRSTPKPIQPDNSTRPYHISPQKTVRDPLTCSWKDPKEVRAEEEWTSGVFLFFTYSQTKEWKRLATHTLGLSQCSGGGKTPATRDATQAWKLSVINLLIASTYCSSNFYICLLIHLVTCLTAYSYMWLFICIYVYIYRSSIWLSIVYISIYVRTYLPICLST